MSESEIEKEDDAHRRDSQSHSDAAGQALAAEVYPGRKEQTAAGAGAGEAVTSHNGQKDNQTIPASESAKSQGDKRSGAGASTEQSNQQIPSIQSLQVQRPGDKSPTASTAMPELEIGNPADLNQQPAEAGIAAAERKQPAVETEALSYTREKDAAPNTNEFFSEDLPRLSRDKQYNDATLPELNSQAHEREMGTGIAAVAGSAMASGSSAAIELAKANSKNFETTPAELQKDNVSANQSEIEASLNSYDSAHNKISEQNKAGFFEMTAQRIKADSTYSPAEITQSKEPQLSDGDYNTKVFEKNFDGYKPAPADQSGGMAKAMPQVVGGMAAGAAKSAGTYPDNFEQVTSKPAPADLNEIAAGSGRISAALVYKPNIADGGALELPKPNAEIAFPHEVQHSQTSPPGTSMADQINSLAAGTSSGINSVLKQNIDLGEIQKGQAIQATPAQSLDISKIVSSSGAEIAAPNDLAASKVSDLMQHGAPVALNSFAPLEKDAGAFKNQAPASDLAAAPHGADLTNAAAQPPHNSPLEANPLPSQPVKQGDLVTPSGTHSSATTEQPGLKMPGEQGPARTDASVPQTQPPAENPGTFPRNNSTLPESPPAKDNAPASPGEPKTNTGANATATYKPEGSAGSGSHPDSGSPAEAANHKAADAGAHTGAALPPADTGTHTDNTKTAEPKLESPSAAQTHMESLAKLAPAELKPVKFDANHDLPLLTAAIAAEAARVSAANAETGRVAVEQAKTVAPGALARAEVLLPAGSASALPVGKEVQALKAAAETGALPIRTVPLDPSLASRVSSPLTAPLASALNTPLSATLAAPLSTLNSPLSTLNAHLSAINSPLNPASAHAEATSTAAAKVQALDSRNGTIEPSALIAGKVPLSMVPQLTTRGELVAGGKPGSTLPGALGQLNAGIGRNGEIGGKVISGRSMALDSSGGKRYLTGAEIGLLIAAVGIAKNRIDARNTRAEGGKESADNMGDFAGKRQFSLMDGARRFPGRELTLSALLALTGAAKVRDLDQMLGVKTTERTVRIERTIGSTKKEQKVELILPPLVIPQAEPLEEDPSKLDNQLIGLLPAAPALLRLKGKNERDDDSKEDDKENDKSAGSSKLPVLRFRRIHRVADGETLVSIAESRLKDSNLAWLIADINAAKLTEKQLEGKRVVEILSGQEIELPLAHEISAFYRRNEKKADPDNLVTIIVEPEFDKDRIERHLNEVLGLARS